MRAAESRTLIDINVYLASLVSDIQEVDPLLDPMREVTALLSPTQDLDEYQAAALQQVKRDLENYLLTRESARFFTPESLQAQIDYHFKGNNARRATLQVLSLLVIVAGLTALVGRLKLPNKGQGLQVTVTTCFALLHISAALLFILALKAFTARLQTAFWWVCSGIVVFGLSLVVQPLWAIFGIHGSTVATFTELLPLLAASIAFYIGTYQLTVVFKRAPPWLAPKVTCGIAAAVALLVAALSLAVGHGTVQTLAASLHVILTILILVAASLVGAALPRMTELYRKPILSLTVAIGLAALIAFGTLVSRIVFNGPPPLSIKFATFGLVVLLGCSLVLSGYMFNKASRY